MVQQVGPIVEPEGMSTMLNTYLSEMVEVAFAHGATVDKFMRDMVMGFFGAPTGEGPMQDARRCARMAIEMWQRATMISGRWRDLLALDHPPLPTMVLTSGSATVGNFGSSRRLEYTAIGGPLDEADTLLQEVGPGEVACSQTTWTLIKGEVEGELSNEVKVRNRERPVKLFRIAGPAQLIAFTPAQAKPPAHDEEVSVSETSAGDTGRLQKGTVLSSRYQILQALGKNSTGTIYMARDLKLEVEVALKVAQNAPDADTSRHERLHREVMLTRLVHHTSVAQIFDLGEWQGYEFIIMEYIQGDTLEQRLGTTGALPVAEGQRVLQQLCAGLGVAHAASLVHRDLKPSNIILGPDGRVVILDFGVARWVSALHQTESGARGPVGTPSYMAPEQFASGEVDQRADIYSLGVVAFEMFTGRRPFDGDSTAKLERMHTQEPPPDPLQLKSDLPPRLTAVILRCLEKSPQDRFSSVVEIPSMLEESNP
jgi:class 3 adenylate cyclase/predicted Ser/Thr protein kinase